MKKHIYKISPSDLWQDAENNGSFTGAPIDIADGFIHFSTAEQARETASKHFKGQTDLLLVAIDEDLLGGDLKYEVSRGGALFPHLYGTLSMAAVIWVKPLLLDENGDHIFPEMDQ
jgi:uncharacterized protein (DUF952 family)